MSDTPKKPASASAADQLRQGAEKARETLRERVVEPARKAGEALQASGRTLVEGNAAIGLKMIDQAEDNVHKAFAAMREAASAKDISEVMRIQADFLRQQGSRSLEQAREVGEMIAKVGRDAVGQLRPDDKPSN
ncbi:MAG: TIGR01841 family phasin [Caulobacteraceae bacterium]|nr:TIGR01841 family phasin [Caulobacteraceae bacterium]